jgi:hypothetical protein
VGRLRRGFRTRSQRVEFGFALGLKDETGNFDGDGDGRVFEESS